MNSKVTFEQFFSVASGSNLVTLTFRGENPESHGSIQVQVDQIENDNLETIGEKARAAARRVLNAAAASV